MKPTDSLKEEYGAIKLMLHVIGAICSRLQSGKEVELSDLDRIVEFIRVFADSCHHGKEEELLFPAMAESGIPVEGCPIGVMLAEHN